MSAPTDILTPPRAQLLYLLFSYETSLEESSLFVANKLAYFLQRLGNKQLNLRFKRHLYGPYAHQVDHVMYALNGTYIQGLEQRQARAFERLHLVYDTFPKIQSYIAEKLSEEQKQRLEQVLTLIEGFESPLSLEALSTVDSILGENPSLQPEQVLTQVQDWNTRKKNLFTLHHIQVAYDRLVTFSGELGYGRG